MNYILFGPDHPSNNIEYKINWQRFIEKGKYECLLCRAHNIMDPHFEIKGGVFHIIPWYLCFDHLPRLRKFTKFFNMVKRCCPTFERNVYGMGKQEINRFKKFIESSGKKGGTKNSLLKNIKQSLSENIVKTVRNDHDIGKQIIDEINGRESGQRPIGTHGDYKTYISNEIRNIIKESMPSQETYSKTRQALIYINLALKMIEMAQKWSKGNQVLKFTDTLQLNQQLFEKIKKPQLWEPIKTPCEGECNWVDQTKYPCIDNICN